MKSSHDNSQLPLEKRALDPLPAGHKHHHSASKSSYIGLTLMEYFQIGPYKEQLPEIDEESASQVSGGTPCFRATPAKFDAGQSGLLRKRNIKTEVQQSLFSVVGGIQPQPPHKMVTINFQDLSAIQKNSIKLPSIRQKRQGNLSRHGFLKDGKVDNKQSMSKRDGLAVGSATAFLKSGQNLKAAIGNRQAVNAKKSLRVRVTSTSFYHGNKERERMRTEEEITDRPFEKSFIITRYGCGFSRHKEESGSMLKKYENSMKMSRN